MRLNVLLRAIIRMLAALSVVAAVGLTSTSFLGFVNPEGISFAARDTAAYWYMVGCLSLAGILWVLTDDLCRWLISGTTRPLAAGIRIAAFITAAASVGSVLASVCLLLFPIDPQSHIFYWLGSASVSAERQIAVIAFFAVSVATIFAAPKIDELIAKGDFMREERLKMKSGRS